MSCTSHRDTTPRSARRSRRWSMWSMRSPTRRADPHGDRRRRRTSAARRPPLQSCGRGLRRCDRTGRRTRRIDGRHPDRAARLPPRADGGVDQRSAPRHPHHAVVDRPRRGRPAHPLDAGIGDVRRPGGRRLPDGTRPGGLRPRHQPVRDLRSDRLRAPLLRRDPQRLPTVLRRPTLRQPHPHRRPPSPPARS